jgi:Hypothetical glycosyl hydrolase family 15/IPT/TIG domain
MNLARRFRRVSIAALAASCAALPANASAQRHANHRSHRGSNRSAHACKRTRGAQHQRARTRCRGSVHGAVLSAKFATAVSESTFGKTSVGASSDSFLGERKRVNRYTLPASGAVSKLEIYLAPTSNAGQQVLRGVIYADASAKPQALLAVSEQLTFQSSSPAGWYALPFAAPVTLGAGNYWIGVISGASNHVAGFRYDALSGSRFYNTNSYGLGASNPFGAAAADSEQMSLYATYSASGAPAAAAPAVSGVSPASGPEAGGTPVTISGANLSGATAVMFAGASALGFTVNSAGSISAVSPPGRGVADVTVTTGAGPSASSSADRFTYLAPTPPAQPPAQPPDTAGEVRFVKTANSSFDGEAVAANAAWITEHFSRMITWSPFFDERTSWYPNAWVYHDAYAIYTGSQLAGEHPEWILKDTAGEQLYIPFGSPPTQYAGDISNPAFRHYWIERTKAIVAHGYRGVFVDDVDMWANVANVRLEKQTAISGVTGQPIGDEAWREYFAAFMAELRAALPGSEIADNAVWYQGASSSNRGTTNPWVRNQVEHANVINIERGVNDGGLTGGQGNWSLSNLFTYVDEVHALGDGVVLDSSASEVGAMEYNLAAYFLISNGQDFVDGGGKSQTVTNFWPGWAVNLGEPTGPRERSNSGLWKRSFKGGVVYLLEPGATAQTVTLPRPLTSVTLGTVSSITLSAHQAAVLSG